MFWLFLFLVTPGRVFIARDGNNSLHIAYTPLWLTLLSPVARQLSERVHAAVDKGQREIA